jgi:hypothetical protein
VVRIEGNESGKVNSCDECCWALRPELKESKRENVMLLLDSTKVANGLLFSILVSNFCHSLSIAGVAIRNPAAFSFEIAEFGVLLKVLGISPGTCDELWCH